MSQLPDVLAAIEGYGGRLTSVRVEWYLRADVARGTSLVWAERMPQLRPPGRDADCELLRGLSAWRRVLLELQMLLTWQRLGNLRRLLGRGTLGAL